MTTETLEAAYRRLNQDLVELRAERDSFQDTIGSLQDMIGEMTVTHLDYIEVFDNIIEYWNHYKLSVSGLDKEHQDHFLEMVGSWVRIAEDKLSLDPLSRPHLPESIPTSQSPLIPEGEIEEDTMATREERMLQDDNIAVMNDILVYGWDGAVTNAIDMYEECHSLDNAVQVIAVSGTLSRLLPDWLKEERAKLARDEADFSKEDLDRLLLILKEHE